MSRATILALALGTLAAIASPQTARADGQPVVSLPMVPLAPGTGLFVYGDRPQPLIVLPVRRIISNGENTEVEYDTSAQPQIVTSCPNPRSVQSGDSTSVECDEVAAKSASHALPQMGGGHNSALWNLRGLPASLR